MEREIERRGRRKEGIEEVRKDVKEEGAGRRVYTVNHNSCTTESTGGMQHTATIIATNFLCNNNFVRSLKIRK